MSTDVRILIVKNGKNYNFEPKCKSRVEEHDGVKIDLKDLLDAGFESVIVTMNPYIRTVEEDEYDEF